MVREMLFKGREIPYPLKLISTVLFVVLIFKSFWKSKKERVPEAKYTFCVPDMDCKHCQTAIELDEKLVKVDGQVDGTNILKRIEKAGYTANKVES
jgi:copper chaperone CopZ